MEMNDDGSRHTRSLSAFAGRALVLRYSKGVKHLIIMMPNYFIRSTNWMEMKCKREQKKTEERKLRFRSHHPFAICTRLCRWNCRKSLLVFSVCGVEEWWRQVNHSSTPQIHVKMENKTTLIILKLSAAPKTKSYSAITETLWFVEALSLTVC